MPRADRLDRKQLKQDALLNFMVRASDTLKSNANLAIGVVLAAVILVVLLVFWSRGRTERSLDANVRAEASVGAFAVGEYQTALQMADGVIATYPGSRAAVLASYVSGQSNLQLGNFIAAEQNFQRYLQNTSKEAFYENSGRLGLAASLEGQQRYPEAADLYVQTAEALPERLAHQALLDAARCWRLMGDYDQAGRLLEGLVNEGELMPSRAEMELAVVEALRNATPTPAPEATGGGSEEPSSEVTP